MRKMRRKMLALTLAACTVAASAVSASAGSHYDSGVYNGQPYGTTDICTTEEFYSETGSSSQYMLSTEVQFYYWLDFGFTSAMGTVAAGPRKYSAVVSGDGGYAYSSITSRHYVNGSCVSVVTVNS